MDPLFTMFWKPLAKNPDWSDISPIEPDPIEQEDKVVWIDMEPAALEVLSYLYALSALPLEASRRALMLSRKAILCNMCGYTAWAFRLKVFILRKQ